MTLLTDEDLMARFGVTRNTLRRERSKGRLTFVRVGRSIRYTEDQVTEYLKCQTEKKR